MPAFKSGLLACLVFAAAGQGAAQTTTSIVPAAAQQCELHINVPLGSWIVDGYDPYGGANPSGAFDVIFVNQGDRECRFYPQFQTDQAPFGLQADTGPRVPYTLFDGYGNYDATPLGGRTIRRATMRPVVIEPHGQQTVRYLFQTEGAALPGDGLFLQRLFLEAEDVDGTPIIDRQILVGVRVLPTAVMSLAGAFTRVNGQADVDLGELTEGVARVPLQLHVRSTRAYHLNVESLNAGKLRLGSTAWSIPYDLIVDGKEMPAMGGRVFASARTGGPREDDLPLGFSIGSVQQHRAGVYSDLLTLTVSVD